VRPFLVSHLPLAAHSLTLHLHAGFRLLLEPFETDNATVPNPVFHLVCLDASLAIAPVFERFSSVIITSGTLSPLDMYPKMLRFDATVLESYVMTLTRDCFLPLVRPSSSSSSIWVKL